MSKEILEKVIDYLNNHKYLSLGTVTAEGAPQVHTLAYVSEGTAIYFVTNSNTRKVKNIEGNPAVALTVDGDYENWQNMQAVQASGKASIIMDPLEIKKASELLLKKFPQFANLPPDPDMIFIRVDLTEAYYLDSTVSFGHRDRVEI